MIKTVGKIALVGALSLSVLGTSTFIAPEATKVEAATKLPDNHTIEELKVEWRKDLGHGYLINVGNRKGTLLIRVDQPKVERNIEWVNWALKKPNYVSFQLDNSLEKRTDIIPFFFSDEYVNNGGKRFNGDRTLRYGMMKFSDFSNSEYYAALSIYLPEKYNNDGTYWFGGNSYALQENNQVKAYFFEGVDLVKESMEKVGTGGTFPLLNKVMWGKTELWKGQLGKVTIKKSVDLLKKLDNGRYEKVRELNAGDEFRVYKYLDEKNGYYGVGAGMYVEKNPEKVLYETPSKRNLRLVRIMHGES
ncbi:hypothetical protein [Bacillus sp. UMB0728]|uniref:hypothetical protein n=1 Tax=Bacillus sp. UMB0728 TaxID=2066052 RepID=UPI000C78A2CD|nr:hypothetical protein [Bacillus sp. UMB0728]PLR70530.1 hypothetical protein CYJ37_23640 [Bacillus sp. UMB0728]